MPNPFKRVQIDLSLDGNMWCALIGDNIQEGTSGWGETPLLALQDLAQRWDFEREESTPRKGAPAHPPATPRHLRTKAHTDV